MGCTPLSPTPLRNARPLLFCGQPGRLQFFMVSDVLFYNLYTPLVVAPPTKRARFSPHEHEARVSTATRPGPVHTAPSIQPSSDLRPVRLDARRRPRLAPAQSRPRAPPPPAPTSSPQRALRGRQRFRARGANASECDYASGARAYASSCSSSCAHESRALASSALARVTSPTIASRDLA